MHAEIMSTLKCGNLIQNILFSILLSKNIKIKTYRTIGTKLGLMIHRKHKLRALERPKREKEQDIEEYCIIKSCTLCQVLFR